MKKSLLLSYVFLILLTVSTALISNYFTISSVVISLIMSFSAIKFILVAFQFMELKEANSFWKISLLSVLLLIIVVIILAINN
ncbi:heme/copper-type cytochrome/quinol oxidase subunit 4 [Flavobacterium sp. PL11]|jgi:heme/copper-type cytochrome/quinol oxidase subunit 4|uniref:cytochrome C oxidase subunit IV family protein n=1 Tax=Flavobacterium sp. PL11 TaxID=3071717 RepID=UPI002E00A320|nr:heme/copper-type cytochrome/quinol oxidase subunit 4 [Flavobacterium sp. PL11]